MTATSKLSIVKIENVYFAELLPSRTRAYEQIPADGYFDVDSTISKKKYAEYIYNYSRVIQVPVRINYNNGSE